VLFLKIHRFGSRYPLIRTLFNPFWQPFKLFLWRIRILFFSGHPIKCYSGEHSFLMIDEGQISKYMWAGSFENVERDFVLKSIKPGMRVLNIGANAGLYTILASKLVGDSGEVHAFEPSSQNYELLIRNIEINECKNVLLNKVALADFSGNLTLYRDELNPDLDGHFHVRGASKDISNSLSSVIEEIPCISLDEYWVNVCGGEIKPIDFIIIDVEGSELSVFQGAQKTFSASPDLVMILECTEFIDEIQELLSTFNFQFYEWNFMTSKLTPSECKKGSFIAIKKLIINLQV